MNLNLAKWELEILLDHKNKLKLKGRELNYDEDSRIKKLREFLDSVESETNEKQKTEDLPSQF